jgi:spermidine/putrescine transport system substrate-binding protein
MREPIRALVSQEWVRRMGRRRFLGSCAAPALAGLGGLACGSARDRSQGGSRPAGLEPSLSLYTWAEYVAPANRDRFASMFDVSVSLDVYDSDEALLAKLELAGSGAGYDVITPSTRFLPQLVRRGLIRKLDRASIPNLANQDPAIVRIKNEIGGDETGEYAAIKAWGSTGFVYDTRVIREPMASWGDFLRVAALDRVSGLVSVLTSPSDVTGIVFWRDGIDWRTTDPAELDHAESTLLRELAPHLKAFDGFPAVGMLAGEYVLSQAWNGDARYAVIADPDRFRWVLAEPTAELWVDAWTILEAAPHPEAAHAWIDFMLRPDVAATELQFHGYNTGVVGMEAHLPDGLPARDVIFFSPEQIARLVPGAVNEAQDRIVEIYNTVKVAAGRA